MITHRKRAAHQWGLDAEAQAADFLRSQGWIVLAERLRTIAGEIDVLAWDGEMLVIVEVKARNTQAEGLFSITPAKRRRLERAAEAVLMLLENGQLLYEKLTGLAPPSALNIRFDAVIIVPDLPPQHLSNAWQVE